MLKNNTYRLVAAALFLALALVLPFLTGQIPEIGGMLCPMHIPVLLCGFICGAVYGGAVGLIAPMMRSLMFGMPPLFPTATAMCFELCAYGLISGILYKLLKKKAYNIYISLFIAMLGGRIVWGLVTALLCGISGNSFGLSVFFTQAFVNAVPGIIVQIILIPLCVISLNRVEKSR